MIIHRFDPPAGCYHFTLPELTATAHAHPAAELLLSASGTLEVERVGVRLTEQYVVWLPAGAEHAAHSDSPVEVLMLEGHADYLAELLGGAGWSAGDGEFPTDLPAKLLATWDRVEALRGYDARVRMALKYLANEGATYDGMIDDLRRITHLSESRLSHLFRAETGFSLKKYLVWSRLKRAFVPVAAGRLNMYAAALDAGFYDQAHLSRAFKRFLGLAPSLAYNSRTVQEGGEG